MSRSETNRRKYVKRKCLSRDDLLGSMAGSTVAFLLTDALHVTKSAAIPAIKPRSAPPSRRTPTHREALYIEHGGMVRKPLHFDGEPDRFSRTRALFAEGSQPGLQDLPPGDDHPGTSRDTGGQRIVTLWRTWLGKAA